MTMDVFRFIFVLLLLPLTASSSTPSSHNTTDVTIHNQSTKEEASSSSPPSGVSGRITQATMGNDKTATPSDATLLQTTANATLSPNTPTTATNTTSFPLKSSTMSAESMTTATTAETSKASNPTTGAPPTLRGSTQSQHTENKSTSKYTTDKTTDSSGESVSTESQSTVTGSTGSTGLLQTSKVTAKTASTLPTETKTRQESGHSKAVAGIIGGALVLMMLGFLLIYIKKRKLQRHHVITKDWAGPSPFLEGGDDNGQVTHRSSNQISLSSFLPHRLSQRLSLLPEIGEEMEDMAPGSTFGNMNQGTTFGKEVNGNDEETNGTAGGDVQTTVTGGVEDTVENSESSSHTNEPLTTKDNSEDAKVSQDPPASPTAPPGSGESPPVPLNNGQPSLN